MSILTLAHFRTLTNTTAADGFDAYITSLLPVVQSQVEYYCDRHFDASYYKQWFKFTPCRRVLLPEYPVNTIVFIGSPVTAANITIDSAFDYTIQVKTDRVTVIDVTNINYAATDYLFADNTTLTALKTEIEDDYPAITVAIVSGYETTSSNMLRPCVGLTWTIATRVDCHALIEDGTERTLKFAEDSVFSYNIDFYFPENLYIIWNAGYTNADMPDALQNVCANIIKDMLAKSKLPDIGLIKSQTITNYSITYADTLLLKNILDGYADSLWPFVKKQT
uniref:Uncharacterized protein n=1 Tax=viral metagenome TaxID=1070528 RepID=A0A6M3KT96_9ZZZZ